MARQTDPMASIPTYAFWHDGCAALTRHTCDALQQAGLPVTAANAVRFVESLARFQCG